VSQVFALEQLEAAVERLSGAGSLRHRLASAWVDHLVRIDVDKDLPGELRQRFRGLPMFGRPVSALPVASVAALNLEEMQAAAREIVALRDRVRFRLRR
jgi:hypothetical protein